jgi:hypothetical protein
MANFQVEGLLPGTTAPDVPELYEPKVLGDLGARTVPELVSLANEHCVDAGSHLYLGRAVYGQTWDSDPATAYEGALMASLGAQGMAWEPDPKKPPLPEETAAAYNEESDHWHGLAIAIGDDIEDGTDNDTTRNLLAIKTISYAIRAHTLRTALDGPGSIADSYRRESIAAIDDATLRLHEADIPGYPLVTEALGYAALSEAVAGDKRYSRKLGGQVLKLAVLGASSMNVPVYNKFAHHDSNNSRLAQGSSALVRTLRRRPPDARAKPVQRTRQAAWRTMLA